MAQGKKQEKSGESAGLAKRGLPDEIICMSQDAHSHDWIDKCLIPIFTVNLRAKVVLSRLPV